MIIFKYYERCSDTDTRRTFEVRRLDSNRIAPPRPPARRRRLHRARAEQRSRLVALAARLQEQNDGRGGGGEEQDEEDDEAGNRAAARRRDRVAVHRDDDRERGPRRRGAAAGAVHREAGVVNDEPAARRHNGDLRRVARRLDREAERRARRVVRRLVRVLCARILELGELLIVAADAVGRVDRKVVEARGRRVGHRDDHERRLGRVHRVRHVAALVLQRKDAALGDVGRCDGARL